MRRAAAVVLVALCLAACSAQGRRHSSSSSAGSAPPRSAPDGLVAFADRAGIEVADPLTGALRLAVPIRSPALTPSGPGRFLVDGPVWVAASGEHPALVFVLHDQAAQGPADDVFLEADPFGGTLTELAAVPDYTGATSGLTAVGDRLVFTFGCCGDVGIDDMAAGGGAPRRASPPDGGIWASLGGRRAGMVAAERSGRGARSYLWLDPTSGTTAPIRVPAGLAQSATIGPVALSHSGTLEALAVATSPGAGALDVLDLASGAAWRPEPGLGLPSGLAFAPSGAWLAVTAGGSLSVVDASGKPAKGSASPYHLAVRGSGATHPAWSAPISGVGFTDVRAVTTSAASLVEQADAAASPPSTTTTSTTTTTMSPAPPSTAAIPATPDLYVGTGANLGSLYPEPDFPFRIQVDNHDYVTGLSWTGMGPTTDAVGTGTYDFDTCSPDCAAGTYQTYAVKLTASRPAHCTVQVYDSSTGGYTPQLTYVYDILQASLQDAGATPTPKFSPACS